MQTKGVSQCASDYGNLYIITIGYCWSSEGLIGVQKLAIFETRIPKQTNKIKLYSHTTKDKGERYT